jgi:cytochrome c oxidase subunit 2
MTTWSEGLLALMVLTVFGAALFLFAGGELGSATTETTQAAAVDEAAAARGQALAESTGCLACHTVTGVPGTGPTFLGLAGSTRPLASGESVTADDAYLFSSIVDPANQIVEGYEAVMPPDYGDVLTETEVEDLVEYIKSLSS